MLYLRSKELSQLLKLITFDYQDILKDSVLDFNIFKKILKVRSALNNQPLALKTPYPGFYQLKPILNETAYQQEIGCDEYPDKLICWIKSVIGDFSLNLQDLTYLNRYGTLKLNYPINNLSYLTIKDVVNNFTNQTTLYINELGFYTEADVKTLFSKPDTNVSIYGKLVVFQDNPEQLLSIVNQTEPIAYFPEPIADVIFGNHLNYRLRSLQTDTIYFLVRTESNKIFFGFSEPFHNVKIFEEITDTNHILYQIATQPDKYVWVIIADIFNIGILYQLKDNPNVQGFLRIINFDTYSQIESFLTVGLSKTSGLTLKDIETGLSLNLDNPKFSYSFNNVYETLNILKPEYGNFIPMSLDFVRVNYTMFSLKFLEFFKQFISSVSKMKYSQILKLFSNVYTNTSKYISQELEELTNELIQELSQIDSNFASYEPNVQKGIIFTLVLQYFANFTEYAKPYQGIYSQTFERYQLELLKKGLSYTSSLDISIENNPYSAQINLKPNQNLEKYLSRLYELLLISFNNKRKNIKYVQNQRYKLNVLSNLKHSNFAIQNLFKPFKIAKDTFTKKYQFPELTLPYVLTSISLKPKYESSLT